MDLAGRDLPSLSLYSSGGSQVLSKINKLLCSWEDKCYREGKLWVCGRRYVILNEEGAAVLQWELSKVGSDVIAGQGPPQPTRFPVH